MLFCLCTNVHSTWLLFVVNIVLYLPTSHLRSSAVNICKYLPTSHLRSCLDDWGPKGPLLLTLWVFFILRPVMTRTRSLPFFLWDPWSPVQTVYIYPRPPVASFILVIPSLNLVVSYPYVLYYLYLHTFMLFRSICSGIFL